MKEKKINLYADGIAPDINYFNKVMDEYGISGFTCNPTLIKNYLPMDYYTYCKFTIDNSREFPVSIQVLSSNLDEMINEAKIISSWGKNVYVKVPIINEFNESSYPVIKLLFKNNIKLNITAVFELDQIENLFNKIPLPFNNDYIISVFSGRIADTGRDPQSILKSVHKFVHALPKYSKGKILWGGTRQVLDIYSAQKYCDIITIPTSVLDKLSFTKKTLSEYCVETVQMFARDSKNFTL